MLDAESSLTVYLRCCCVARSNPTRHQPSTKYYKGLALFFSALALLTLSTVATAAGEVVVASTSLTGAIARAAGATEVRVLTPANASHPPEYDLKPSDLLKLEGARVVVYAGYERMVSRLVETARDRGIIAVQVDTTLSPETLIAQVRNVAAALKTEKEAGSWGKGFLQALSALKAKLAPVAGKRAVVHWHARAFSSWAGLNVVQVVPLGELTPKVIADSVAQKPDVVVDILHSPVAKTIAENAKCKYVQIINFPGVENTASLTDIFEYNTNQMLKAFVSSK
ncbi:MAG TPA: metal ABC transporter substrate-binding protein [Syntrophorhabdales bacterium]|nr:metal ABC transporter substrate-binding protein [Syntrophorhabdales bacterium]